jgi:hypothetical protein
MQIPTIQMITRSASWRARSGFCGTVTSTRVCSVSTLIELIEHDERVPEGPERRKLARTLNELYDYLESNRDLIPDYGDRRRHGEAISSSIAESTVNHVISRRFVKKQQMRWQPETAHLLLQVRTRTLNGRLRETFQRWWPAMTPVSAPASS